MTKQEKLIIWYTQRLEKAVELPCKSGGITVNHGKY